MNTLYLDIFSGLSGDMLVGALLDLGVDFHALEYGLAKLGLDGYHLHHTRQQRSSITGVKFDVHLHEHAHTHSHGPGHSHSHPHSHDHGHSHDHADHQHDAHCDHDHDHDQEHAHDHDHDHDHSHAGARDFAAIRQLIQQSSLGDWVKERSIAVFQRIAVAEGKVHGVPPDQVHFHEVGAIDSIVDIVGACIALDALGRPRVLASTVVEGTGWVKCAHGRFPIPTAATLEILGARGVAVTQCEEPNELVTPTGAALLAEFAESFGPINQLVATRVGYGLGTRENRTRPNVVRAVLGTIAATAAVTAAATAAGNATVTPAASGHDWEHDTVSVLETNLDDIPAELLGAVMEQALATGALDVFHTPIQMKKNRPGVLLTILCGTEDADRFTELLLRETSALGVRRHVAERRKLRRELVQVQTAHGTVTVKLGFLDGRRVQAAPEFESCRSVAQAAGISVRQVYDATLRAIPSA